MGKVRVTGRRSGNDKGVRTNQTPSSQSPAVITRRNSAYVAMAKFRFSGPPLLNIALAPTGLSRG